MRKSISLGPGIFAVALVAMLSIVFAAPAAAQPAPTNLQITVTGSTMHLTWVKPAGACQTTQIEMGRYPGGNDAAAVYIGPVESYNYTYPYPGTYYVRVRCNIQTASNEVMVVLGAGAPPAAPEAVKAAVSGTTVSITWAQTSSGVTGYRLEAGSGPGLSNIGTFPVTGTGLTVPNVPPGTYYLRVRSVSPSGQSVPSAEVTATVGPGGVAPGVPGPVQSTVNGNNVFLSWGGSSGNLSTYRLEAGSAPGLANITAVNVASTVLNVPGVPNGTYYVRVRALGPGGQSAPTADAAVTVSSGCVPPSPAQALTGSFSTGQVSLSWQAPAVGTGPFTYTLGAGFSPGATNAATVALGAALSLNAQAPPGTYFVRVAATNACGTSVSPDITVTVP
jgi:predicted phage tail protein